MSERGYLLANAEDSAAARLAALSELFDPTTFRHLAAVGLGPGWRVWEVGAGGPGVPRWLAEQVGPDGRVLATDIDTSHIDTSHIDTDEPQRRYESQVHDLGRDPAPAGGFDLIHARLVLVHVPDRDRALNTMVTALRPGGWLVVEDADPELQPLACLEPVDDAARLANRLKDGFRELMRQRGVDLAFGRSLPRRLRDAGLVDVQADAYFPVAGPACDRLEIATVQQIRSKLLDAGIATDAEIDAHLRTLAAGHLDVCTSPLISAWGRRPK